MDVREYCVKITETRYEYVEARNEKDAIEKAEHMAVSNADSVECEVVNEPGDKN
jgi:hypothetical protein